MTEPAETRPTAGPILIGCAAVFLLVLGCLALPDPTPPTPPATLPPSPFQPAPPPPTQVSGGGLTLTSTSVDFPDDDTPYAGPGADLMNSNCTACHSANMVLAQPALSAAQWKATVEKMRNAYKAPVQEKDVPDIVAYLTALSAKLAPGGADKGGSSTSASG